MKAKYIIIFPIIMLINSFSNPVHSQNLLSDYFILKIGPCGSISTFNKGYEDADHFYYSNIKGSNLYQKGFAVQAEYNLNFYKLWLSFGLEYQWFIAQGGYDIFGRMVGWEKHINQYIQPISFLKYNLLEELHIGIGLSGKYLFATERFCDNTIGSANNTSWGKESDLWTYILAGFDIKEINSVLFKMEFRVGYNITQNQFKEKENNYGTEKFKPSHAFDLALLFGIGYRLF